MSFSITINDYQYNDCWFERRTVLSETKKQWYSVFIMSDEYGYPEPVAKVNILNQQIADELVEIVATDPSLSALQPQDVYVIKDCEENQGLLDSLDQLGVIGQFVGIMNADGQYEYPIVILDIDRMDNLSKE